MLRLLKLPGVTGNLTVECPRRTRAMTDLVVRLVDRRILHIELHPKRTPTEERSEDRVALSGLLASALRAMAGCRGRTSVVYTGGGPLTTKSEIKRPRLQCNFIMTEDCAFLTSENPKERIIAALCQSEDPAPPSPSSAARRKACRPRKSMRRSVFSWSRLNSKKRHTWYERSQPNMPVEIDVTENVLFQEGKARAEAKVLVRFLKGRFGPLPEPAELVRLMSARVLKGQA